MRPLETDLEATLSELDLTGCLELRFGFDTSNGLTRLEVMVNGSYVPAHTLDGTQLLVAMFGEERLNEALTDRDGGELVRDMEIGREAA